MKKISSLIMAAVFSMGLFACSNEDDPAGGGVVSDAEKVYMSFDVSYPTVKGTKTATESAGELEGTSTENKVSGLYIALVSGSDLVAVSDGFKIAGGSGSNYNVSFQKKKLLDYAEKAVDAYVICNAPEGFNFNTSKKNTIISLVDLTPENTPWNPEHFLMTNSKEISADNGSHIDALPSKEDLQTKFNDITTPFDFTQGKPIEVERAAARFDFQAIKPDGEHVNVYNLEPKIDVVLTKVALANINKTYYAFKRVSDNGTMTDAVIGGEETNNNYVVDSDFDFKQDYLTSNGGTLTGKFFESMPASGHEGYTYNPIKTSTDKYETFAYATENTTPAGGYKNGITTAVVFKGKLKLAVGAPGYSTFNDSSHGNLYVFNNKMIGGWSDVVSSTVPEVINAYNAVKSANSGKNSEPEDLTLAANALFTVFSYKDAEDGYPVYYDYFNKHNDAGASSSSETTPMYYGVVRNNIYKLKITDITKYGHPYTTVGKGDGDPGTIDPADPVDPNNVYFKVALTVKEWAVRDNDIKF